MKTTRVIPLAGLVFSAALLVPGMAAADDASEPAGFRPELSSSPTAASRFSWKPLRYGVAIENRTSWQLDDAAERLMGKRVPRAGGLSLQYDALELDGKFTLGLDLVWLESRMSSTLEYSSVTEKLNRNQFDLGVSLRYQVWRWLAPYLRVAGGMGWDRLRLSQGADLLADTRGFGEGSFGGGIFLRTPSLRMGRRFDLGIMARVEGGYVVATGSEFALKSSQARSGADAIPTSTVTAGHIDRNVPYLRVMFGVGF
jgi:hypothetical protein